MTSIASLWRYPVKSMMGEELRATKITEKGVLGDRALALLDVETGKIVSAKNPKKWPTMFSFHSRYEDLPNTRRVRITLPDGSMINSDDAKINAIMSHALGREVTLISQAPRTPRLEEYRLDIEELDNRDTVTDENIPEGAFFDFARVHLLTTSTLDELRLLYPAGRFEVRRFRPNIVARTDKPGFTENDWVNKTLVIGDEVRLKITCPCPRCAMTTLSQGDLPQDTGILKTAVRHNEANVGVYAEVIKGGTVRCDDRIEVVDH
ncbi:MAG: hypothetical protein BECKG1743E_GA0114224_107023 [Candidatus Kentron sp. G]|nr:MAG: hypothetical protein BECKG1743E_GA0114224_107023 [Candidatus Kentron sp. G]